MSIGGSAGGSYSKSDQSSRVSTPEELQAYFNQLDKTTGGRLGQMATEGTAPTQYNALSQQELQNIGGAGATRQAVIDQGLTNQQDQINSNNSMTYAQRNQANQQATENAMTQKDAINKEVEAAMTGLASQENQRQYGADLTNNQQLAQDMALLSQIFYGGKGQYSTGSGRSYGLNTSANVGLW